MQNDIEYIYSSKINKLERNYNKKKMRLDKKHMDNLKEVVLIQNACTVLLKLYNIKTL
jgi:hypothetical protein